MKEYRKVWSDTYGPIPCDEYGRTYEIHHIDGDRSNNELSNLRCLTIAEHLQVHLEQGDLDAAAAIAKRMNLDEALELNRLAGLKAKAERTGIHALTLEQRQENGRKGAQACIGLKWYNNGVVQTRTFADMTQYGWERGGLPRGKPSMPLGTVLGVFWNKDGVNKRSVECPGAGWIKGRYLTPQQREVRSQICKAIPRTEESNLSRSNAMKGKPHGPMSNETRAKISETKRKQFEEVKHGRH